LSFNLIDTVEKYLTPDFISKASSYLGETELGIRKALSGVTPSVLGALVSTPSAMTDDIENVFNTAKETHRSNLINNTDNFFTDGGRLIDKGLLQSSAFIGDKTSPMVNAISTFAEVKKSSVSSLVGIVSYMASASIGKYAEDNKLSAGGLMTLFNNQRPVILKAFPLRLDGLVTLLGIPKISKNINTYSVESKDVHYNKPKSGGANLKWAVWLFAVLIAGFFAWFFFLNGNHGCQSTMNKEDNITIDSSMVKDQPELILDTITGTVSYSLGQDIKFTLPDDSSFMAAAHGFESMLLEFIKSGNIDTADKSANWFNMFDVQFGSGGISYTGKSEQQLNNCAAILKAYPAVKIKLGGYTDNTGSAAANLKISQQRADKVKEDLIKRGAGAEQITEAVGYGSQFPVCEANDTKQCQARNRRVACKVALK